ncbi:MAG: dUTP pyrophosphatase [Deltaproteobacteria bacterium]|nr:dUTP pyrophosphatase [Deltaproteobacteria bacterium]
MELKIQCHFPGMTLPGRAHPDDAGMDLTAMAVECQRAGVFAFDTGISVAPESGYYCEVVPRSSIVKSDFIQGNSVGVIDPSYRGRILVVLRYLGSEPDAGWSRASALVGTRIAQLLVRRLEPVRVVAVETLDETRRGSGGFGSSGH